MARVLKVPAGQLDFFAEIDASMREKEREAYQAWLRDLVAGKKPAFPFQNGFRAVIEQGQTDHPVIRKCGKDGGADRKQDYG